MIKFLPQFVFLVVTVHFLKQKEKQNTRRMESPGMLRRVKSYKQNTRRMESPGMLRRVKSYKQNTPLKQPKL
jgi:hypothetical protein